MTRFISVFCCLLFISLPAVAQESLQSPAEFLGYPLGSKFTPHHRVIDYYEHVARVSDRVTLEQYGETYEGRPLITAFVTTPEHHQNLEEIRVNNLRRASLAEGDVVDNDITVVWLSYNVHGNESVSMEASLKTLYVLANPEETEASSWLENAVVVMDPCLNPDGRDRYASWYNHTVGRYHNVLPEAREHREPWPGGRTNHYYFDLNRDWAWQSQIELQKRVPHYQKWMPQVHVDFHEQGVNSPYYFAPAAEPYHNRVSDWQREFQEMIGRNHARYFDENSWLYFTAQVFDLLYPGYGDTWPTFNGAIGMTYEQAGGGRAGLGILTEEADTLTLGDRIAHHHTTGLSTVEVTVVNQERVLSEFESYFERAVESPEGPYVSFVIKRDGPAGRLNALANHLKGQDIQFGYATEQRSLQGHHYQSKSSTRFTLEPGDMVIDAHQPRGNLVSVLFEPETALADTIAYDITAWSLPFAYGLEAYALSSRLTPDQEDPPATELARPDLEKPYAYLVEWKSFEDARFLAMLLKGGIKLRFNEDPFSIDGKTYNAGTLIITRTGNEALGERFDQMVREAAIYLKRPFHAVTTGFVDDGPDFGSGDVPFLKKPHIMLLTDTPTSPYNSGETWHYFDQQLEYPISLVNAMDFNPDMLEDYEVLILPSGSYSRALPDAKLDGLKSWIRDGGRVIAMQGAVNFLAGKDGFEASAKKATPDSTAERVYGMRQRDGLSRSIPGAIYRVKLDNTHPLAYGFGDTYFTLHQGSTAYTPMKQRGTWNVGVTEQDSRMAGFVGSKVAAAQEDAMILGVQDMGSGSIVYFVDNPMFRGFWYTGRMLMANAVFFR